MDFSGFSLLLPKEAPLTPEQEAQLQALAQTSALNFNAEDIKTTLDTFGHSRAAGFFWVALSDNLSSDINTPHWDEAVAWLTENYKLGSICQGGTRTPLSELCRAWKDLFENIPSIQTKLNVMDLLACGTSSPDNENIWPFLWGQLSGSSESATSDKFRASVLFALHRMGQYKYGNEAKMATIFSICREVLSNAENALGSRGIVTPIGPMFKLSCARYLLTHDSENQNIDAINVICDVVVHPDEYAASWESESAEVPWALFQGAPWTWKDFRQPSPIPWGQVCANSLRHQDGSERRKAINAAMISALRADVKTKNTIVGVLLSGQFPYPLPETDVYFQDLSADQQSLLLELLNSPKLFPLVFSEEIPNAFTVLNIPSTYEGLLAFAEQQLPPHLQNAKRFPPLDDLYDIDWASLEHAYGPADDVPSMIQRLVAQSDDVRNSVWNSLYSAPFHQGSRYPATPPLARFIIRFLEYDKVHGKSKLLSYLHHIALGFPEAFMWSLPPAQDIFDEAELECYQVVEEGVPTYLQMLADENQSVRVRSEAIQLVGSFPSKAGIVEPELRTIIDNVSAPLLLRVKALVSLSRVIRDLPEKQQAFVEQTLSSIQWASTPKWETAPAAERLWAFYASFAITRFLKDQNLPDAIAHICMRAAAAPEEFHHAEGSPDNKKKRVPHVTVDNSYLLRILNHFRDQMSPRFLPALTATTEPEAALKLAETMLGIFWEERNGYFSMGHAPEILDLSQQTPLQIQVLKAFVKHDPIWNGNSKLDLRRFIFMMHQALNIGTDPTRELLEKSLASYPDN